MYQGTPFSMYRCPCCAYLLIYLPSIFIRPDWQNLSNHSMYSILWQNNFDFSLFFFISNVCAFVGLGLWIASLSRALSKSQERAGTRARFFSKVNKNVKCQKQQHEEKKAEKTTELLKTEDFQIKFVNGSLT